MQWALLNTIPLEITVGRWNEQNEFVYDTWEAEVNTIFNLIVYDGVADYTPPENFSLQEVDDDKIVGDVIQIEA